VCSVITAAAAEIPIECKNWSNEWFEEITLGERGVLSNTIRLATVVEGKRGGGLGGLLSRAAVWGCQLEQEAEEEKEDIGWQVRRYWRGFRLPGEVTDVLAGPWENVKPPLSGVPVCNGDGEGCNEGNVNAIAWRNGRAHTLRIIQNRKPVRESDIRRQLDYITSLPASPPKDDREANVALLSWRCGRTFWSQLHSQLLAHAPNLPAFKKLYNSAISIALDPASAAWSPGEDEDGLARLLDEVRHGRYSPNRHADVTFSIVSFGYGEGGEGDGKIGLTFDHTPADCGAATELSKILGSPAVQEGEVEEEFVECNFTPERLEFTFPPGTKPDIPESVQEKMPREVRVLTLNTAGRSYVSGGLVDVCLNLALQATMAPSATGHQTWPVIYQPVSQPNCYKGRCGPGGCTTTESIGFLSSLFPSPPSSPQEEDLIPAFEKYLSRRRDVISAARNGENTPQSWIRTRLPFISFLRQ